MDAMDVMDSSSSMPDEPTNNNKPERPRLPTAKWGAACAPCATAKAKCIRSDDTAGAKCDRCDRLLKECTGQIHRPRKKRQSKPSRTSQIEERLNGLVSYLKASGDLGNAPGTSSQGSVNGEQPLGPTSISSPSTSIAPTLDASYAGFTPHTCICHPENQEAPPAPESDEVLLDFYRKTLQPVNPFVVIPPTVTAATLKATRPFLMAAIRMVSSFRSLKSMRAQMFLLMKHIADRMLIRSEKTLEMLLGILVMLGYQQYHCCVHSQLNNLISLATTLVADLGINRRPLELHELSSLIAVRPSEPCRTNEERRAFAGAWYWASVISMNFGRVEQVRYSNYLQECVRHLEADQECESDIALIYLVRIQQLTDRIAAFNSHDPEICPMSTVTESAYISAFQCELDNINNSIPGNLKAEKSFQLYLNSARLRLYEPPIVDRNFINLLSKSLASVPVGTASPLDKMVQSSAALTAWFDCWLSVPVSSYYFRTTAVGAHLVYALVMLGRWSKLGNTRTMGEGQAPVQSDVRTGNPGMALYNAEMTNAQHGGSIGTCRMPSGPSLGSDSSGTHFAGSVDFDADPDLAAAVAVLRSQLHTQPGLMVDIPEILSAICARFEQAHATFQFFSTDSSKLEKNIWMMTAIKIRLTREKLERWEELVSAGAAALSLDDNRPDTGDEREMKMPEWYGVFSQQPDGSTLDGFGPFQDSSMGQDHHQMDPMYGSISTPWTSDLLSGVDPSVWFDGYLDWGAVIMNSMGSVGQQNQLGNHGL